MKNFRTAQRRTEAQERRAAAGEQDLDWTGALSAERKSAFDAVDPGWCPTGWTLDWQRSFTLARRHVQAGGTLAGAKPGSVAAQGEDLTGWARAQQIGWAQLGPAQRWMCEHVLGLEAQIAFPVILNRFPGLRRAGEPVRRNQLVRRCYQTLPVTLGSLSRDAVVGTCPPGGVLAIQSAGASR